MHIHSWAFLPKQSHYTLACLMKAISARSLALIKFIPSLGSESPSLPEQLEQQARLCRLGPTTSKYNLEASAPVPQESGKLASYSKKRGFENAANGRMILKNHLQSCADSLMAFRISDQNSVLS